MQRKYKLRVMPKAIRDIDNVYDYIAFDKCHPMAAERYQAGIYDTIYGLAFTGDMYPINYTDSLQRQYGPEVRTVRYKKMVIIYVIRGNNVVVLRVTAGSLIV